MAKDNFYQNLVKPYQQEMMKSLKELIAIDSTYDESTRDKENPFGKGVSKALQYVADFAKKDGFIVNNYDNMNNHRKQYFLLRYYNVLQIWTTLWIG